MEGLDILFNKNGLQIDRIIMVGTFYQDPRLQHIMKTTQNPDVLQTWMDIDDLVQYKDLENSLIILFEGKTSQWSSEMLANNQWLFLINHEDQDLDYSKEKIVQEMDELGIGRHLQYDSQVYVGFTDYESTFELVEVSEVESYLDKLRESWHID